MNDFRLGEPESVEVLRSPLLAGTAHGFLGRRGGVSTGIHAGLNVGLGSDDDRAAVADNRARAVAAVLPGARLATVHQVHSSDAITVTEPWGDEAPPRADALVTDRAGVLLGILTADCAPVLLADVHAGVVGAAHAGWKGALGGIVEETVAAMARLGAERARMAATVGPCIARASYEVDETFLHRFCQEDAENHWFFDEGTPGHWQFDLECYVGRRLSTAGVGKVVLLGEDTYAQPERFFSYRRATHRGEPGYGRQIALIGLE
ncbi:MAG: peptidoglycan editing factor PgeF [Novosphingobium sp.]